MSLDLRPWPPQGMNSERWQTLEPRWVAVRDLVFTQHSIDMLDVMRILQGTLESYSGDQYPHVVLWQGTMYLEDGHHRVAAALIEGRDAIRARVLYINEGASDGHQATEPARAHLHP